jgi:hypothetical protein
LSPSTGATIAIGTTIATGVILFIGAIAITGVTQFIGGIATTTGTGDRLVGTVVGGELVFRPN